MTNRIGVDIGGTFTDGVILDDATGVVHIEKMLTSHGDLSDSFIGTVDSFLGKVGGDIGVVDEVLHASTIATNALLEGKGAKVGLIVTAGFRDVLEIGRQVRHELYNFFTAKPQPLVPRRLVMEVRERVDHSGTVVLPIEHDDVRSAAVRLREEGVESIAICFLHSYRNDEHERAAAAIVSEVCPGVPISVSSTIAPEIKEYWRASTSCVNAYVGPVVNGYLDQIVKRLDQRGYQGNISIMHSGGGLESLAASRERPFHMIESGPAAGLAAAGYFARALGYANAISFDMGGTTAKAGLILNGTSRVLSEFEVAGDGHSGSSVAKASGYPVLGEVVDLVEVGAGGGSLAWLDDGGHLRVGPEGAGSNPGPACYGLGGQRATITDANLVLGRLDKDYFLGGGMTLSLDAAHEAVQRLAPALALTTEGAAKGITDIADATMIAAIRLVSVERGHDPRDFCLIAFGGAGPVHAASLAVSLGIRTVLIPPNPGVASAWGLLLSDVKLDERLTSIIAVTDDAIPFVSEQYARLYAKLQERISDEAVGPDGFRFEEYVEARYVGQSSRLRVAVSPTAEGVDAARQIVEGFHSIHEREFGFRVEGEPVEIVTLGISAIGTRIDARAEEEVTTSGVAPTPRAWRDVIFDDVEAPLNTPVYRRGDLRLGDSISGPAVVDEFDTAILVSPEFTATVLRLGVLKLEMNPDVP